MDLGSAAPASRRRVDRATAARGTGSGASARSCPPTTRSTTHPQASSTPRPGTVLRSRDVELAFLGLIPQRITATQLLYRTTDMHGNPEAAATTVIVPAERGPGGRHAGGLLPVRDRRGHVALLPVVCAAAARDGDRVRSRSSSSC